MYAKQWVHERKFPDPKISVERTEVAGLHIRYAELGKENKENLLMIHGGGISIGAGAWTKIMPLLGRDYHVIAPDMPGYGESQKPKEKISVNYYVGFIESFMEKMRISTANLVAESFGGGVAMEYSIEHRERVNNLALISSYGFADKKFSEEAYKLTRLSPQIQHVLIKAVAKSNLVASVLIKALLKGHNGSGPDNTQIYTIKDIVSKHDLSISCLEFVQSEVTKEGIRTNFNNKIQEINETGIPILFLHGTRDALFPIEKQREAAMKLRNARFVTMDSWHQPELTEPEQVSNEILKFLKRPNN